MVIQVQIFFSQAQVFLFSLKIYVRRKNHAFTFQIIIQDLFKEPIHFVFHHFSDSSISLNLFSGVQNCVILFWEIYCNIRMNIH